MSSAEKKAVSETLGIFIANRRSLTEIIEDISDQAERNGLTPETLEKLLKEIDGENKK